MKARWNVVRAVVVMVAVLFLSGTGCTAAQDESAGPDRPSADSPGTTRASGPSDPADVSDQTQTTRESDGSGEGPERVAVEVWAEEFCGNFQTWLKGVGKAGSGLGETIIEGDLTGARAAIAGLFQEVEQLTSDLIAAVRRGGVPDIARGEAFREDLEEALERFRVAIEAGGERAEAAEVSDPITFQATITQLVSDFQIETESVTDSLSRIEDEYPDPQLDDAVTSACTFLP